MGAEAYTWITKYKENLAEALENARRETFAAGKFLGAEENPATIEEAMEFDPEGGTGSLLEIIAVSEEPELCCACRLPQKELVEFFGTDRPTYDEIMQCLPFWESFDRGEARAIVLYENDRPAKICFAAWTIDNPAVGNGSYEDAKPGKFPKAKKKAAKPATPPPGAEERAADLEAIKEFIARVSKGVSPENMEQYLQEQPRITALLLKYSDKDTTFWQELWAFGRNLIPGMPGGNGE